MYLAVGLVAALMLVMLSPAIWLAWWLVAGLGERAGATRGFANDARILGRHAA